MNESSPEKAGVGGSTPSLATTFFILKHLRASPHCNLTIDTTCQTFSSLKQATGCKLTIRLDSGRAQPSGASYLPRRFAGWARKYDQLGNYGKWVGNWVGHSDPR